MYKETIQNNLIASLRPLLETRMHVYGLLRQVFLEEPSQNLLDLISNVGFIESFPFVEEQDKIREGVNLVLAYLHEHDVNNESEYSSLHWDYTRMFIGPDKIPAPLWESAYLNKDQLLFQEQTLMVRQAYLKYQFLPKYFMRDADDHLGLELDFMYQLSLISLENHNKQDFAAFKGVLEDQKTFLTDHLLKWVPELTDKVIASASLDFYPGMAKILSGYLSLDLEALNELLDTSDSLS